MDHNSLQDEPMDLSITPSKKRGKFQCPKCPSSFEQRRYLTQHEIKHKPPEATCKICQPPVSFRWRNALINHRAKVHQVVPYLCAEEDCEQAFATSAELKEHGKEKHTKCNRCEEGFLTPAGLKLHQKKCADLSVEKDDTNAENLTSVQSMDSGVTSDESKDSMLSDISAFSSSSSSLGLSVSRHREDSLLKVKASCSKQITQDMKRALFGLPMAVVTLIFAHKKGIGAIDDEFFLEAIWDEGEALFKKIQASSSGINGPVGPSLMQGPIRSDLSDVDVKLTFSLGVSNPQVKMLNRNELFPDLRTFTKKGKLGVLQVGEFYMALVAESADLLYVLNPGVGTSSCQQDLSGDFEVRPSLIKCHGSDRHRLVDALIHYFTVEHGGDEELEYVILPVDVEEIEQG